MRKLSASITPVLRAFAAAEMVFVSWGLIRTILDYSVWWRDLVAMVFWILLIWAGWIYFSLKTVHTDQKRLFVTGLLGGYDISSSRIDRMPSFPAGLLGGYDIGYDQVDRVHTFPGLASFTVCLPIVTVVLKEPYLGVKKIRFLAWDTKQGWVDGVHPDVIFLRQMIQQEQQSCDGQQQSRPSV